MARDIGKGDAMIQWLFDNQQRLANMSMGAPNRWPPSSVMDRKFARWITSTANSAINVDRLATKKS